MNELLCFLQNKLNVLPIDTLVQLCAQFYSSQAIEIAKKVPFSVAVTTRRLISHRGPDKSKNDAHDILRILLEQKKDGVLVLSVGIIILFIT